MQKILIDRFIVPKEGQEEFFRRVQINRDLIKTMSGFVTDSAYIREEEGDEIYFVTVAIWESEDAILNAKKTVTAEYQKQSFDLTEMLNRLGISIERGIFETANSVEGKLA